MLKAEDLPLFAGLMEVIETKSPKCPLQLRPTVQAPWRDTKPPSWRFVVSLVRNIQRRGER